mmetsp:Transcript_103428/g.183742  ORF Transcript_103428/g.183742 Transcript_103428/m.183742 type:complete len:219 (+) Transcript_103428:52-708(+)|eukprot:CAMPEP_0197661634 /NCGR_PEP_ID=MMETSP1338-20131121/51569_1 /TAXON_ID=43686 ORGANISM="Pelagodinium beii, Strain RCC1491" /NCGR_SAMPLE_ID=MMETSP1338 /ASSEMBLY_ACC=CAM_ASM_000754 /LENGTH=218 /DNA_ID=CAMNT_0043239215 /DNA_START=51 /DNA_END=707 /DNA_ORIENTATION=-
MDVALDDLIKKEKPGKGSRRGGAGGRNREASSRGFEAASIPRDDLEGPRASAADLRELDTFGGLPSGGGKSYSRGSNGSKGVGKGRSARYEPYGGSWGKGGGRRGSYDDDDEEDDRRGGGRSSSSSCAVTIGNLDFGVMAEDLEDLLQKFDVEKAWIDYDSTDRSLGSGGATFMSPEAAAKACRRFHGSVIDGQKVFMDIDHGKGRGKGKRGKGKSGW